MQYEKEYCIGAREIGINNQITNYGMLALLEDIAGMHSDVVGYGVKDIEVKKKAWILMEWKVKILKRQCYGENLRIKTWAKRFTKPQFYTYRDFEVYNSDNELVAIATSKWVLLDIEKGRISKIGLELIDLYKPEDKCVFGVENIEKLSQPDFFSNSFNYKVRRSDIDVNKHMHNLNYLNVAYEVLPEDIYNGLECNNVRITYKHQIKLGDKVKCYYSCKDNVHTVVIKSEDEKTIHSIIELK
ncbi:MAG: hypothetical protein HFJ17_04010 [Clostridia bacterium]|nr:hypothetical protein [Clostridia bacterium]